MRRVEGIELRRNGVCSDATLSSSQSHKSQVNIFRDLGENAYINTF